MLQENYREWEKLAWANEPASPASRRTVARVERVRARRRGLQAGDSQQPEFLSSIAAARQEAQTLYELTQDLGNSLNLHETLSVLDSRLQRLIPYDAIAVYVLRDGCLLPEYVNGENFRLFSSLEIPWDRVSRAGWRRRASRSSTAILGRARLSERSGKFSNLGPRWRSRSKTRSA